MTVDQAVKAEARVIKLGNRAFLTREKFVKSVQQFRRSGGWAITPQHHSTFSKWCRYAAPKMKIGWSTLQAYGCPNYIINAKRVTKTWFKGSLTIFPEHAKIARKAITLYCKVNGLLLRKGGGEPMDPRTRHKLKMTRSRAIGEICKEYISVTKYDTRTQTISKHIN